MVAAGPDRLEKEHAMNLPRRLRVAPLLLTLLLTAGPLAAANFAHRPPELRQPGLSVTGLLSEAWSLLSRVWEKEGSGIDPFGKEGGSIDPFGNPAPSTAQPPSGSTSTASEPASGN
jgi:hypothetical protein